ncbi:unnamed protein product [Bursaphelenchus okinawaensis]|uniref:Protein kinase domain-containing protein n=1 Tax=Bursaphelenchus okinawaensis TaxID=465554 RepID=A0A811K5D7_9BILA|nr:unnamed protein product [Bursaphelenchus okinawaensis]CAG9091664.1 unnamed protein product [Bursaphelenchus okinawaensis]
MWKQKPGSKDVSRDNDTDSGNDDHTPTAGPPVQGKPSRVYSDIPTELFTKSYYFGFTDQSEVEMCITEFGQFAIWGDDSNDKVELKLTVGQWSDAGQGLQIFHIPLTHTSDETGLSPKFFRKSGWKLAKSQWLDKSKTYTTIQELIEFWVSKRKLSIPASRPDFLIRDRELNIGKVIGEGNFCVVSKGFFRHNQNDAPTECAVKEFKDTEGTAQERKGEKVEMRREASTMRILKHYNIIQFYGFAADTPNIKLVMELCNGGSLLHFLQTFKEEVTTSERVWFAFEVSRAMRYVESVGVIHRDLAARNCLISRLGVVKIADFGMSRKQTDPEVIKAKFRAPIRLMSPETIGKHPKFSSRSDVWAFGMLLWEIFTNGDIAWPDSPPKVIARAIKDLDMPMFPAKTPCEIQDLVNLKCWIKPSADRINFDCICKFLHTLVKELYRPLPPPMRCIARLPGVTVKDRDDMGIDGLASRHKNKTSTLKTCEEGRRSARSNKTTSGSRTRSVDEKHSTSKAPKIRKKSQKVTEDGREQALIRKRVTRSEAE